LTLLTSEFVFEIAYNVIDETEAGVSLVFLLCRSTPKNGVHHPEKTKNEDAPQQLVLRESQNAHEFIFAWTQVPGKSPLEQCFSLKR
jgi:hypothetical protein